MPTKVQTSIDQYQASKGTKRKHAEMKIEDSEQIFELDLEPMTTEEIEERLRFALQCIKDGTAEWETL